MRLMQKQQQNSNLILNATSFSNTKNQEKECCPTKLLSTTQHLKTNLRENIQESGVYAFAKGCECKGYQAELKLTNKYAARFGMDESDQRASSFTRYSGNNYMMHSLGVANQRASESYTQSHSAVAYQAPAQNNNEIVVSKQTLTPEKEDHQHRYEQSTTSIISRGMPS